MREILKRIHGWPEEARKLLAGALIAVVALGFFGVWGRFFSSRLTALGPAGLPGQGLPGQGRPLAGQATGPVSGVVRLSPLPDGYSRSNLSADNKNENQPPSPAQGVAQTLSGLEKFFPKTVEAPEARGWRGVRGFFAAVGNAVAGGIDSLYLKLSRYVPSNL